MKTQKKDTPKITQEYLELKRLEFVHRYLNTGMCGSALTTLKDAFFTYVMELARQDMLSGKKIASIHAGYYLIIDILKDLKELDDIEIRAGTFDYPVSSSEDYIDAFHKALERVPEDGRKVNTITLSTIYIPKAS